MRIQRIQIDNFRNFHHLDVSLAENAVIVGENKVGKSNLIYALRLILDPSLPDTSRQLRDEDFWDGIPRPLTREAVIRIAIDFADFEDDFDVTALLGDFLVTAEPMVARITFQFQVRDDVEGNPTKESDFDYLIFGGDEPDRSTGHEFRRRLPLDLLAALRDAEGDLNNWRRSPLRPLLDSVAETMDRDDLVSLAEDIDTASQAVAANPSVRTLVDGINDRITGMVGANQAIESALGFSPSDPDRLLRSLRLLIDSGRREVGAASLGSANVLYLALKSLQFDEAIRARERHHTFLAIEEPEAHLHPHLQRLVYRSFLRDGVAAGDSRKSTVLLTTHSPHIASVSPLTSIVLLRRSEDGNATVGVSTAHLGLEPAVVADIERYLDVTRAELLFARGILFVEGDAERYIVPAIATASGTNLDELGISVCSISGTNFAPYAALVGRDGLQISFGVITDGDPSADGVRAGEKRVRGLLRTKVAGPQLANYDDDELFELAENHGLKVGDHTLEVDLFNSGLRNITVETLVELAPGPKARGRAQGWLTDPATLDVDRYLADVEVIGKGRFAQRLASKITNANATQSPQYILEAIDYVQTRCR